MCGHLLRRAFPTRDTRKANPHHPSVSSDSLRIHFLTDYAPAVGRKLSAKASVTV